MQLVLWAFTDTYWHQIALGEIILLPITTLTYVLEGLTRILVKPPAWVSDRHSVGNKSSIFSPSSFTKISYIVVVVLSFNSSLP